MKTDTTFSKEAIALQQQLIIWRRALHQIPEVGTQLPQTMIYIREQLENMGIPYKYHEDISCMEATIGAGEKCFLLRSDVDGSPVVEEADVPFKSTNGCMHDCGHDMHGAILLGAAKLLKDHEEELKGTVKLLFQSGEEIFQGAKAAIEAKVLEEPTVDAAFAVHVIAMTYRCQFEYETLSECASVVTDDAITASVEASIKKVNPNVNALKGAHGMGSEDFAEITQRVPSAYFMMGAGLKEEEKRLEKHNPKIEFNEEVLSTGAAIYAQAAKDWLGRL